ncbi:FtsQ protein [Kutzneria sp. 744]|nr:FtsQ protein [Kutzneria sp. 744]
MMQRYGWLVAAAATGVVVVLVAVVAGGSDAAPQPHPGDLPPLGQPVVVQEPGGGEPLSYGDTAAYDACALLSTRTLGDQGVRIDPGSSFIDSHLDGDVPADAAVPQGGLDSISNCRYTLVGGDELSVTVQQTPFTTSDKVDQTRSWPLQNNAVMRHDRGLEVSSYRDGAGWTTVIGRPKLAVTISFDLRRPVYGDRDQHQFVLDVTRTVVDAVVAGAAGPAVYRHTAPFTGVKSPCLLLSSDAFQQAYPGGPSSLVLEYADAGFAAVPQDDGETALRTSASCVRSNVVPDGALGPQYRDIRMDMTVWDKPQWTVQHDRADCGGQAVTLGVTLGDGASCLTDSGPSTWNLSFRTGRSVITLSTGGTAAGDRETVKRLLTPVARAVVTRLR